MNRTAANYYRDERARLVERHYNVGREQVECRARLAELQDESALLGELLSALDAHVPEADEATTAMDADRVGYQPLRTA